MLNEERKINYDFGVFAMDGICWLVDLSEVTYPCTTRKHYYCEAMYFINGDFDGDFYDGHADGYFLESTVMDQKVVKLDLNEWSIAHDVESRHAWDSAREEAKANHYL